MGIRMNESLRVVGLAALVVGAAAAGIACGGDDDGGGVNTSSGGTSGSTSGTSGTSSGSSGTSSGSTSSSSSSSSSSSGTVNPDKAATPTFDPPAGSYSAPQSVVISDTTPNATIFFTLDGTNPNDNSTVFANAISVANEGTTTIRAIAKAPNFAQSDYASASYTITLDPIKTKPVTYQPAAGQYNNPVPVGLASATPGATICYTIDGSAPACNNGVCQGTSAQYSAGSPIPVDAPTGGGGLTVQAIACSDKFTPSDPTQSIYSFKVADVTAEPATNTVVAQGASIALHTETASTPNDNVRIKYNIGTIGNVTNPTCSLFDQQGPNGQQTIQVAINQNSEIRAVACRNNYADSTPQTFIYRVKLGTPVVSTTLPADGDNNNVKGSVTGVRYNAMASADAVVIEDAATGPTGTNCYRMGADPVCIDGVCDATGADATSTTTLPAVNNNAANNIRARQCAPNFIDSDVVQATYTFTVQTVSLTPVATGPTGSKAPGVGTTATAGFCSTLVTTGCYEPTNTANFYDLAELPPAANEQRFVAGTAKANTSGNQSTGTVGETVRWAFKTGTTDLPQPADPTCADSDATFTGGAGAAGETRGVCTADGPTNCNIDVPPFTTIKAIGCKGDFVSSQTRTLTYANPSQIVSVATPTPSAPGPYSNDTALEFATTPAQPTATAPTGADVHVCWTQSLVTGPGSLEPTCDQVTGQCTAPTGTVNAEDSWGEYYPSATAQAAASTGSVGAKKPLVYRTGSIVKAIACKAGVPKSVVAESLPYRLKVAKPTFDKADGFVGFDTPINFATATTDSTSANVDITYRRSNEQVHAADPSCTGDVAGQQKVADFINQFDQDCGPDGLGTQCATPKEEIKLIACKAGYEPSDIATGNFEANLAAPTLAPKGNPARGFNTNQQAVVIDAPFFTGTGVTGGRVCYSDDGGVPTCGAGETCTGTGGVIKKITATTTVQVGNSALPDGAKITAIACATGFDPSPSVSATYNFHVQQYSVTPAPGAQPNGGNTNVAFVNTLPGANGEPATAFTCSGGTNNGTACTTNAQCTGGGTCSNDPTTSPARTGADALIVCYSIDGTEIPADCTELTNDQPAPGTQHVFCSTGSTNGAGSSTFHTAGGQWAPTSLQGIASSTSVKSRACKAGFVSVARPTDSYTFGKYSRAETIDGNNTFDGTQNKIARPGGTWSSVDANTETADTTNPNSANGGGSFFVSWTATDVYVGFQGNALTSHAGSYFQLYVKGSGTGIFAAGNTSRDNGVAGSPDEYGDAADFTNPTPGAATGYNFHFFINPAGGTSTAGVRVLNAAGTNWIVPTTAPNNSVMLGGTLGQANAYVEWRISRADLGIAADGSHLVLTGNIYDPLATGSQKGVKFPVSEGSAPAWGYLNADMDSSLFPAARAYTP